MKSITRTFRFTTFTLIEYMRSGRILVELLATVAFFYLILGRSVSQPNYFFSAVGLFMLAVAFYTTSAMMGLGDRPQGYVILARRLGRSGYLLGFYFAAMAIVLALYVLISLGVVLLGRVEGLDVRSWLLGSLPLLLNAALFGALLTLLAPMVLSAGLRLVVLALIALAFSGSLIGGQTMSTMPQTLSSGLDILRTVFSTPLLPALTGFELSVSRDYTGISFLTPITQLFLTIGLLALASYAFTRRDIMFSNG